MSTTKVLLVEDDKIVATVYQSMLAGRGYEVTVAEDGEAGFNLLNSVHPHVVLMDLMLPKLHGIELLRKIRAIPDYEDLPLFVFTNVFVPNLVSEATNAGATAVFSKSTLTPRQLLDAMSVVSGHNETATTPRSEVFQTQAVPVSPSAPSYRPTGASHEFAPVSSPAESNILPSTIVPAPAYIPPPSSSNTALYTTSKPAPSPAAPVSPAPTPISSSGYPPTPTAKPASYPAVSHPPTPASASHSPQSPAAPQTATPSTFTAPPPSAPLAQYAKPTTPTASVSNKPTGHTQFVNRTKAAMAGTLSSPSSTGNTAYWLNEGARLQRELRSNFTQSLDQYTLKLRSDLTRLVNTGDETNRLEILQSLHAQVRTLASNAGLAGYRPIADLSAALEAFLRDLVEKSKNYSPSSQRTLQTSLDVLACLMQWKIDANLLEEPAPAILVVDDEVLSRRAVTFALEKGRLRATAVDNPEEGLALASRQSFDLIFLDVQMPGIDGFELCTRIRAEKFNKETPVIFVTSMSDFKSRAKSTLAGGTELIAKPFLFIELTVKAVTSLLQARGAAYQESMLRKIA